MNFKFPSINKSSTLLRLAFVLSLVVFFFMASNTYNHFKNLNKSTDLLIHSYEIKNELESLFSYIKDAETGFRGYLLYKDTLFLAPYTHSREKVNKSFIRLKKLMADEPSQEENLKQLYHLIVVRYSYFNKTYIENNAYQHYYVYNGQEAMDQIREKIAEMNAFEAKLLDKRSLNFKNRVNQTPFYVIIILTFTLLLIIIAFTKLSRYMSNLRTNVNKLQVLNDTNNFGEKIGNYGSWKYNFTEKKFTLSDNLYRLLGVAPNAIQPNFKNFIPYIHPDSMDLYTDMAYKIIHNIEIPELKFKVIRADSHIRYFKIVSNRTQNKLGNPIIVGTTLDITEEHYKNKQIAERNKELEQNNKELSGFNYIASHDLQEPLRKIQTLVSILEDKEKDHLSESGKSYFNRIVESVERMRSLIDDLLQYSQTNIKDSSLELVNLNEIIENSIIELSQSIEEKKANIHHSTLPVIQAVPFQMQQLFNNLISNAIKYSRPLVSPKINITATKTMAFQESLLFSDSKQEFYKIAFQDNGLGFEQENAEKIFLLFNRLYNKAEYPGTGVGLAICKKIVENHNGIIVAEGIPMKGATFTVYLPV